MKGRSRFCCFMLALQLLSWVSTARTIPSVPGPEQAPQSSPYTLEPKQEIMSEAMREKYNTGVSKIGSTPPICEHKCNGCTPCEAIQVPSTSRQHNHMGIQYANYEPESWKCKCGPSFYSP
ncbi:EPIDERMAL PATTERNING FACTOR-like protein 3 [Prosopis cineraria]|uniref:EPIDERMAL PATTERNING FACTOR-like protein 3 n=1 Tax=Prosopis cineraria TaxID=364024 RepID=UPI00240FE626|nr:EPIDERMAL PATTERNING FACTOR-like protein 3 [Prosopis cineraria]